MANHVSAIEYHERTKHSPESVRRNARRLDWENKPIPYKRYEDLPTVDLPEELSLPDEPTLKVLATDPGAGTDDRSIETARPRLADLARLCYYAVGITRVIERGGEEYHFRAAATTGALYHVDCYVVTGDLDDLDAGVYHFDPRANAFDVLREGDYRTVLVEASGRDAAVAEAPAIVVTTSTWWRNAWKYGERTYRHAFWDAGTSLANLLTVATVLDLPASVVTGFVDRTVADLLGIDPTAEAPLELVPVGTGGDPVPDPPAVERIDPATRPLSDEVIDHPLIVDAYESSALEDAEATAEWRSRGAGTEGSTVSDSRRDGERERFEPEPVDRETASNRPFEATIRRRGSCRQYRRESISVRMLSTLPDRAVRPVPLDIDAPTDPAARFNEPYLIVNDVDGIPTGSYRYRPRAIELELLREGWFRREAGHLALDQQLAADAAVCVYFLSDLERVVERFGDRGYRVAQLEAAITAGRLYLAAYAHRDLGATGLTFYDDAVTSFFEPHASGGTPMFCWTVGRPA